MNAIFSKYLAECGYLTISAYNGEEGWDIFKRNTPDLVLTDLKMPILSGIDLISRIRKGSLYIPYIPYIPIIIVSAYSIKDIEQKALKMGVNKFLSKPIDLSRMKRMIGDILNKSELERERDHYKFLANLLSEENEFLTEKLECLSESKAGGMPEKEAERYNAVCSEVAHDLKSEFMHIGLSLNEIRETAGTSPEIVEECNMIERSLAYSRLLMQRLLNFLEMGSLQREPIELKALIQKIEALAGPRLPSNIRLQTYIPAQMDNTRISGNYEQLMAIFLEFINNASRALHSKGGIIEIKLVEKDNHTFISIKDNGPGIPGELRNKIVKEQVPSKNGGLGIGLFLSGKVIKEFNGELRVETEDGKGTTFTISFPTLRDKKEL
ncbi:MAG: two-component system, NtrC family, sensor kinase [Acidobacteriota bacterium]|nr:two-component system, NtrC family, sensor kinase [Acidobacteriota bacterium]